MPRSVTAFQSGPGFASYTLGKREEFTILAFSALAAAPTGPDDDDDVFLDCLNPNGDVILRQYLGTVHQPPAFYSLAVDAEPFWDLLSSTGDFPQNAGGFEGGIVTMRLSPITLTGSCTLRVYAHLGQPNADDDPFAALDTTYVFNPVHLWVEDARGSSDLPAPLPPLLTHVQA